jgi:hypothetical protein
MHYKKTFALAGVFLAVAIVFPIVVFYFEGANDLIIIQNPNGMQTGGNFQQLQSTHTNNLILIIVVDAVFISLFIVTMYYGIRHIHPTHKPEVG